MNKAQALARLGAMCASTEDPALDAGELADILSRSAVVDLAGNTQENVATAAGWTSATAVLPGAVIVESGRYWRCVVGGTTGTVEPSWPDLSALPRDDRRRVTDYQVVWVDNGTAWAPTYNLDLAAMFAWEAKAAVASSRYTFTTDGQQFQRAQVAATCMAMADRYRRRLSTSTRT